MPLTAGAAERLIEHTGGNPLHLRAVLRELPATGSWLYDDRALPVPRPYAHLVDAQLRRCPPDVVTLLDAVAVLGVRAPTHAALPLAALADPLPTVDRAASTGLLRVAECDDGTWLEFTHPLTRAAVYEAMPHARRSQLHGAAATLALSPDAALHHRVEAHTGADEDLRAELEHAAAEQRARGAWVSAIRLLLAARRVTAEPAERERLTLDAIEALLYSGDGGAARRLAEQSSVAPGARRDSVWAYLAIFAGDLDAAEQLLQRAWEHRGDDVRLAATIAQRRAFMASSRLRGADAIEWAQRAIELMPRRHRHGAARGAVAGQRAGLRRARRRGARGARPLARGSRRARAGQRLRAVDAQGPAAGGARRDGAGGRAVQTVRRREPGRGSARRGRHGPRGPGPGAAPAGELGRRRRVGATGGGRGDRVRGPLGGRAGAVGRGARGERARGLGERGALARRGARRARDVRTPRRRPAPVRRARRGGAGAARPTCSSTCARWPRCTPTSPSCPGSPCRRRRSWTSGASTKPRRSSATRRRWRPRGGIRCSPSAWPTLARSWRSRTTRPRRRSSRWSARGRRCRRSRCRTNAR